MAKNLDIAVLLDFYGEMLTVKQRSFLEYYYNDDLSLSEIAENEGITRQGVRDTIKRAEAQLAELEGRLGLADRFSKTQKLLNEVILCADHAEKINDATGRNPEIENDMIKIKSIIMSLEEK